MPVIGAAPASDPTPSTAADNLAAAVAQIADDAVESVTDVAQASIGAEGASKEKELIERSAAAVGELAQAAGRALGGGVAPNQAGVPATPPAAPPPVPVAPPVPPVGYSSSLLVASGSAADAFQLLFAVLALFSVALLQGGRLSWLRRESHGPPTAVVLAIERPG
jgi:hypothetical protein